MSALGTVVGFEVSRTLKKPAFWIAALAIPVLMAVVGLLLFFSNSTAAQSADDQRNETIEFQYHDESGIVDAAIAEKLGGTEIDDPAAGVAAVRAGEIEAFFGYPADPSKQPIEVAGVDAGLFGNGKYGAVAEALLQASADAAIGSPQLSAIAKGAVAVETTAYLAGGDESRRDDTVLPGIVFAVLFFLSLVLLGNSVLVTTTEEKENRVAEILLTSVRGDTLIAGKLVSLAVIGVVQMAVVATPVVVAYLLFREQLTFPDLDLSTVVFDPQIVAVGALLLITGFAFTMATLVAIGSAVPSAKEAGPFYAVSIVGTVIPLYLLGLIVSNPQSVLVQILTFFPFTAPITALFRNAFGSLPLWQAIVVIAILAACALIMLRIAVRTFRRGAVEYTRTIPLREVLGLAARR